MRFSAYAAILALTLPGGVVADQHRQQATGKDQQGQQGNRDQQRMQETGQARSPDRAAVTFGELDENGDGSISRSELLDALDLDGNDRISRSEFDAFDIRGLNDAGQPLRFAEVSGGDDSVRAQKVMEALDRNGDGSVSRDEMRRFEVSGEREQMARQDRQGMQDRQSTQDRQRMHDPQGQQARAGGGGQQQSRDWMKMREAAIPASELMSGDVTSGFNPVGEVRNLILNEDGTQIEYVLYDVPYPYSFFGSDDGFVTFENVELEQGANLGGIDLRMVGEEAAQPPERLTLTAAEADNRMMSRILESPIEFPDGEQREIENVMVHPQSGKITHFVVELNPDAVFSEQPRAIPANQVTIESDGRVTTTVGLREAEGMESYDPGLL